jgi:hypothetical protein
MKRRMSIEDLGNSSESIRRRNPHLFGKAEPEGVPGNAGSPQLTEEKPRKQLNKTEARFLHTVVERDYKGHIAVQQPTRLFKLTGGGTYTPDFVLFPRRSSDPVHVVEVKGGYRGPGWEQGMERYKRAAAQYSCEGIKFAMATWEAKSQSWRIDNWDDAAETPRACRK